MKISLERIDTRGLRVDLPGSHREAITVHATAGLRGTIDQSDGHLALSDVAAESIELAALRIRFGELVLSSTGGAAMTGLGLALDRTGFTVEDRDRSQGVYFVRYVDPTTDKKEQGFISKLFSGSAASIPPIKYRVSVKGAGESTTVSILNEQGMVDTSANAQRIVNVIAEDLK